MSRWMDCDCLCRIAYLWLPGQNSADHRNMALFFKHVAPWFQHTAMDLPRTPLASKPIINLLLCMLK